MTKSIIFASIITLVTASPIVGETSRAANPTTPSVIYDFYDSMVEMTKVQSASRAYDLQEKMQHCFLFSRNDEASNSGITVPNDFFRFGNTGSRSLTSTLYTQIFMQKAFSKSEERMKVSKIIKGSTYAREADLSRYISEDIPYIQTLVTRTFQMGEVSVTFNDTVITKNNRICRFANGVGAGHEEDLESLRAKAAAYYTAGNYRSAYQTYEKIAAIEPKNANAYYRMGILAFWHGKKCGIRINAKDRGRQHMDRAETLGFSRAKQVRYYMDHPSI